LTTLKAVASILPGFANMIVVHGKACASSLT